MMEITSKRHPIKFYAVLVFAFILLGAMGTALMLFAIDSLQKNDPTFKDYFLPIFSILIFSLAFSMVYTYWKNSPKITVDKQLIKFRNQIFHLKDIKDISLTGKIPFRYILKFPMEGAVIHFNDGTEMAFFDDMYSNTWEIKSFLEQTAIKHQEYIPIQKISINRKAIRFENEEIFKGNQFTSLRGISLWGLNGFFFIMMILSKKDPTTGIIIFFISFSTFWFVLHSWMMHYFGLTSDHLIIRNHNFIMMEKLYRLSDIKEIVFETQSRQPNCMRIITKDFRNKLYPAATLSDKTWLYLKERLERKGVTVRNECIF